MPTWSNVVLQLPLDGTNGATTFPDESASNHTMTARGSAAITTASSVFGGAQLDTPGSGSAIDCPGSTDFNFGTGAFTIEGWLTTTDAYGGWIDYYTSGHTTWEVYIDVGYVEFYRTDTLVRQSSITVNDGSPHHIAVTRTALGQLDIWIDGVNRGSASDFGDYNYTSSNLSIGRQKSGSPNVATDLIAKTDMVRIVKGEAVYTSAFTPPAAPFGGPPAAGTVSEIHTGTIGPIDCAMASQVQPLHTGFHINPREEFYAVHSLRTSHLPQLTYPHVVSGIVKSLHRANLATLIGILFTVPDLTQRGSVKTMHTKHMGRLTSTSPLLPLAGDVEPVHTANLGALAARTVSAFDVADLHTANLDSLGMAWRGRATGIRTCQIGPISSPRVFSVRPLHRVHLGRLTSTATATGDVAELHTANLDTMTYTQNYRVRTLGRKSHLGRMTFVRNPPC